MGVNAQIEVPAFTAGQILTAAEMTQINTGIPVFATTTTRDAAFGGAGEKVLAEGQYAYIEATNTTQFYDGSSWLPVGTTPGMVYVGGASFTGQGTVSMPTATFTSTYKNYQVELVVTSCSAQVQINVRVNAAGTPQTGASYFWGTGQFNTGGAFSGTGAGSSSTPQIMGTDGTRGTMGQINVFDPTNASSYTHVTAGSFGNISGGTGTIYGGYFYNSTAAHDGLTFTTSSGTITGYWRAYGLSES
tara:strand:- start:262 stop:999 length:738 start_codon:yes stop_codon:yes gene_type:complete